MTLLGAHGVLEENHILIKETWNIKLKVSVYCSRSLIGGETKSSLDEKSLFKSLLKW